MHTFLLQQNPTRSRGFPAQAKHRKTSLYPRRNALSRCRLPRWLLQTHRGRVRRVVRDCRIRVQRGVRLASKHSRSMFSKSLTTTTTASKTDEAGASLVNSTSAGIGEQRNTHQEGCDKMSMCGEIEQTKPAYFHCSHADF